MSHQKRYSQKEGERGSGEFQQRLLWEEASCARLEAVGTRLQCSLVKRDADEKPQGKGKGSQIQSQQSACFSWKKDCIPDRNGQL